MATVFDQFNPGLPGDNARSVTGTTQQAEVVTASDSHQLTQVQIAAYRGANSTGTITCEIQETTGGQPNGSVLGSATLAVSTWAEGVGNAAFQTFTFSGILLLKDTVYAIVLKNSTAASTLSWVSDGRIAVSATITASNDDGQQVFGGLNQPGLNTMGAGRQAGGNQVSTWMRFTGITIPTGATIRTAVLSLTFAGSGGSPVTNIFGDDQATPSVPTSNTDYNGRPLTSAVTAFNTPPADGRSDTPSVAAIVQELFDSHGPYSSGVIQFLHKFQFGLSTGSIIQYRSFDFNASVKPFFNFSYTTTNPYDNGTFWESTDDGSNWAESPEEDGFFIEEGDELSGGPQTGQLVQAQAAFMVR